MKDVQVCAKKIIGTDKKAAKTDKEDPPPVDLLVDTLVGYMDKASGDLRALSTAIFGLVSGQVGPSAIEHLVAVRTQSVESGRWRVDLHVYSNWSPRQRQATPMTRTRSTQMRTKTWMGLT